MSNKTIFFKLIIGLLLVVNLAILTRYILFKQGVPSLTSTQIKRPAKHIQRKNYQMVNLELFATIRRFNQRHVNREYKYINIGGNILGFVPLGILFPLLLFRSGKAWKTILLALAISLFFELTQLYTGRGVFDVDDLLLNTTGGIVGFMIYAILAQLSSLLDSPEVREVRKTVGA